MLKRRRIIYVSLYWRQLQDLMMLDIIKKLVPDASIFVLCVGPQSRFELKHYSDYDLDFNHRPNNRHNLTHLLQTIGEPCLLFQGDLTFSDLRPIEAGFKALEEGCCIWSPCGVSKGGYKHIEIECDKPTWTNPAAKWENGMLTVYLFYFSLLGLNPDILIDTLGDDAAFLRLNKHQFGDKVTELTGHKAVANASPDYFGWLSTAAILSGLDVRVGKIKGKVVNAGAGSKKHCFLKPYVNTGVTAGALFNTTLDYCYFEKYKDLATGVTLQQIRELAEHLAKYAVHKLEKIIKMVAMLEQHLDKRCREVLQVLHASMPNKYI